MTSPNTSNQSPPARYVAVLALIAGGILIFGSLLRPAKKPVEVIISEAERIRLQKLTQKKNLEDMTAYFAGISRDALPQLVWVHELQTTGVVWNASGLIVAAEPASHAAQPLAVLTSDRREIRVQTIASSVDISMTTLQAPDGSNLKPVKVAPPGSLSPGAWLVQVSLRRGGGHSFTPGVFSGTSQAICGGFQYLELGTNLPLNSTMSGGGLFDVDGNLVAVVLACGQRYAAVAPGSVRDAIAHAATLDARLLSLYGMRVAAMNAESRPWLKLSEGALIVEISKSKLADFAGLNPGDIIVSLNGKPVRDPADMAPLTTPPAPPKFELKVVRGRRTVPVTLFSRNAGIAQDSPGIVLESPSRGYVVEAVEPGGRAARAGIHPGDRLLEVGGKPLTSLLAARRTLSAANGEPTYAVVERGSSKLLLTLGQ